MGDTYQAIYDAVRSRIGSCDPTQIVREACSIDASYAIEGVKSDAMYALESVRQEMVRPSAIYRPAIGIDGKTHARSALIPPTSLGCATETRTTRQI